MSNFRFANERVKAHQHESDSRQIAIEYIPPGTLGAQAFPDAFNFKREEENGIIKVDADESGVKAVLYYTT